MVKTMILAVALAAIAATPAFAQSGGLAGDLRNQRGALSIGGPSVAGSVNSSVRAGNVTADADGKDATARNVLGSVTGGSVGGDVTLNVDVKDVTARAKGKGACSENIIGSVGPGSC